MTTANKITLSRLMLIPIMLIVIEINMGTIYLFNNYEMPVNHLVFFVLFLIAAFTDFVDGYIARKYNQVTTFGKFLDPIADKVLVLTAMLYLLMIIPSHIKIWAIIIVITREFMVTGLRLIAVDKGEVIAASIYGKIKTFSTIVALIYYLAFISFINDYLFISIIGQILWYFSIFMTVLSGIDYLIKGKHVIKNSI